jgi:hypothetical protein
LASFLISSTRTSSTRPQLVEDRYNAALNAIPDSHAKQQGVAIGHAAAAAIVAASHDGADSVFRTSLIRGTEAGQFRFVEGAPRSRPDWGDVTPFVVHDIAAIRPSRRTT